jgi:hypothetical protein
MRIPFTVSAATLLVWVALAIALLAPSAARAQSPLGAPPPVPALGTPVLGPAALSAEQLADWYASTRVRSTSPTPVATLARIFIDEGNAQGVRGDIAFAQSMLETGYLRYGGQVLPSDHNFSGLGACDSCRRGLAFPDPVTGVRAQIQHLWAYASPTARADATARPNVDIRFDLVSPKGKASLWEQMGNGNWATDPDYARKVLTIYRSMLAWAGLPVPTPIAAPGAGPRTSTVAVTSAGAAFLGGWAPQRTGLSGALAAFGPADAARQGGAGCLLRWRARGIAVLSSGACDAPGVGVRWIRLSAGWRTKRGLRVGDDLTRLARLYPAARGQGAVRRLIAGRSAGERALRARLQADVRGGRVRALIVSPRPVAAGA